MQTNKLYAQLKIDSFPLYFFSLYVKIIERKQYIDGRYVIMTILGKGTWATKKQIIFVIWNENA